MNDQRDDVGYFVAVLPAGCGGVMSEPISENGFAPKFAFKLRSCSILLHQSKPGNFVTVIRWTSREGAMFMVMLRRPFGELSNSMYF